MLLLSCTGSNEMSLLTVSLFLLAGRALIVNADLQCGSSPIYVDVHKRAVNGTNEFVYGSFIGIGDPRQNQSLWPSIVHNETYFTANDFCDGIDPTMCNATITGGIQFICISIISNLMQHGKPRSPIRLSSYFRTALSTRPSTIQITLVALLA